MDVAKILSLSLNQEAATTGGAAIAITPPIPFRIPQAWATIR